MKTSKLFLSTLFLCALALLAIGAGEAAFVTADKNGGWSEGGYYIHNNLWNCAKYRPAHQPSTRGAMVIGMW